MSDVKDDGQSIQRWTAKQCVALVLRVVRGECAVVEAARRHGLTVAEVEAWMDKFLLGAENALRFKAKGPRGAQGRRNHPSEIEGG